MPGGDRTGPMGMGPMTGRGAGYCAGYPNVNPGRGLGRGLGRGRGRLGNGLGFRRSQGYDLPTLTPQMEAEALKREANFMQDEISSINKRISELESIDKAKQ